MMPASGMNVMIGSAKEKAEVWERESLYTIIKPPSSQKDLTLQWTNFNSQEKSKRKISDAKSIELFGKDNESRYNDYQSRYNRYDISDDSSTSHDGSIVGTNWFVFKEANESFLAVKYVDNAVDSAEEWSVGAMRYMVLPKRKEEDLDLTWSNYNNQPFKYQRQADSKSIELFGVDNRVHYEYLKSKFLKKDIEDPPEVITSDEPNISTSIAIENLIDGLNDSVSIVEAGQYILELLNMKTDSYFETVIIKSVINTNIDRLNGELIQGNLDFLGNDLPFFSPSEMIDYGVFSGENNRYSPNPDNENLDTDITIKQWFDEYLINLKGVKTENYTPLWLSKLRYLYSTYEDIKESGDIELINNRKQSILELGWNPEIDFNESNRRKATNRIKYMVENNSMKVIDVSSIVESDTTVLTETNDTPKLKPIYIALVAGDSLFSSAIKMFDRGPFSHATLSFDSSLEKMYTYNISKQQNGFNIESVKKYNPDIFIEVYTIFVKDKEYKKIKDAADYYTLNAIKTKYGTRNLFGYVSGKSIKHSDFNLVCSEFVEHILQISGISLMNKKSDLVTPNDYLRSFANNDKVYLMYKGKSKDYNSKSVAKFVKITTSDAKYIKESTSEAAINSIGSFIKINELELTDESKILFKLFKPYINISEVKVNSIEIDDNGTMLIRNINTLNPEDEYRKCHLDLSVYEKSKSIESMKPVLAKLKFLDAVCVDRRKKLYNKFEDKNEELKDSDPLEFNKLYYKMKNGKNGFSDLNNTRSRIINDSIKYLEIVCKEDPDFNMDEYYFNLPYSRHLKDSTFEITASTQKGFIDIFGKAVKVLI